MKNCIVKIMAVSLILSSNTAWCQEKPSLPEDKAITVATGLRTGCVTDAITGKPLEGAVVVCNWNIKDFSLEGGNTRFGAVYETVTNNNGKYTIPSQSINIEHSLFSHLDPEQAFVYKLGYVWYWMSDKEIMPFVVYVSDLPHIYRRQNNIVKLQPWNNEMSHFEHMKFLPFYDLPMDKLKLLPQALTKEKLLAEEEQKANTAFEQEAAQAKGQSAADNSAYRNHQITREEYINRLHNYLAVPDPELLKNVSTALKNFNDTASIPALIEFLKKNAYKRVASEDVFFCLRSAINNAAIVYPPIAADRKKLIAEMENWWQLNKDKNPAEWKSDDLMKFSHRLMAQANAWKPVYDISGQFLLISGEVQDINDSPVMTVFKEFKAALLADDADTMHNCFSDGIGQEEAALLLKVRPKFHEIADGLKLIDMVSENEYKAQYYLLGAEKDGRRYAYPVIFVRDLMGNWKISQFSEYIKQNNLGR